MKKGPQYVFLGLVGLAAISGLYYMKEKGIGPFKPSVGKTQIVGNIDLPTAPANAKETVPELAIPSTKAADIAGPKMRLNVWEWNAQMGLMYATGDTVPTKGSLMEKYKVNLELHRQDMVDQMQNNMLKFATEYSKNPNTTEGVQGVIVMGDGAPAFLAGLNPQLAKLGPEYRAVIVSSVGYSYGEDAFMGLPEWRANPQKAKGSLVAAYIRDGDWNIAVKWAGDNGIAVNPDEKTYDEDAINFVNPSDYIDAANKYNANYCEDRKVVKNGVALGTTKHVCVNGVATWTPGDVIVAEGRGGLVKIASTKEYSAQMPSVVILIKKWADDNKTTVENFIRATTEGSDQVKCYSTALEFAGAASSRVYKDKDGAYWVKYYRGETKSDKQGLNVELGGSKVNNLSDNIALFGLKGATNIMKTVYNTFGNIDVKLYPSLMPTFPSADSVIVTSFLEAVVNSAPASKLADADVQRYDSKAITQTVSEKGWAIEFESGKATLTGKAQRTLDSIASSAIISSGLSIRLTGHTDNLGDPEANQTLSEQRAMAVKNWLQQNNGSSFPDSRVEVRGMGDKSPVADNSTYAGRAKNRRVVVLMGK
jgi:outer membrane protein OmpA-like peptidoglycan-associated protein